MKVIIDNKEYEVIKDYKNGFVLEDIIEKYTDYFEGYDYILGDWAYGKLRLKGFCDKDNKLFKKINDYSNIDDYIKNNCSYDCRYFIIRKVK